MVVSRPGRQFVGADPLAPHQQVAMRRGAVLRRTTALRGSAAREVAFVEASGSAAAAEAGAGVAAPIAFGTAAYAAAAFARTGRPWPGFSAFQSRRGRIDTVSRTHVIRFARQTARHVRLVAAQPGPAAEAVDRTRSGFGIRTLSITDSSSPTLDLALRKRAIASSSADDDAHSPLSAVDGNPCTGWSPAAGDDDPWIRLDLAESASFDQVCVVSSWPADLGTGLCSSACPRVAVSPDGEHWTEPDPVEDPLIGLDAGPLGIERLSVELGATLPSCQGTDCRPLHVQADPATWQVFAVNHTALRVCDATLTALVYDPFGAQLDHIEQRGLTIAPLSAAPGFIVAWPGYFPRAHLLSLRLHETDGTLLSEANCWRYGPDRSARTAR